ncbi:MAG: tetratricopeptide repeat protein [Deltaproteobacteria bacterium]|nr:tetratricopeptide repeat protein [Deltaproteobacteria bacterium]
MSKKSKHVSVKEMKEKDQVLTTLEKGWNLLEKHAYKVAAFMLGALVISGGWALWAHLSYKHRTAIGRDFTKAIKTYNAPVIPVGSLAGMPKPKGKTFPSSEARARAALKLFDKVVADHGSSGLGRTALFYRGNCYYHLGQFGKAMENYKKFLSGGLGSGCSCGGSAEVPDGLKVVALENLGYTQEAQGRYDDAMKSFRAMEKAASGIKKDWAVYHEARMYEKKGQMAKAVTLYRKVKSVDKSAAFSPLRSLADSRAAYLAVGLPVGQTSARPEARTNARPEARTNARPEARTNARPEARTNARPEARSARASGAMGAARAPARPRR